jgi:hypothetical protein
MTASDQRDRAAPAAGLIGLSEAAQPKELPELATFDRPPSLTSQILRVDRLSKLCPSTGRPDQFHVKVAYSPVAGRCLSWTAWSGTWRPTTRWRCRPSA